MSKMRVTAYNSSTHNDGVIYNESNDPASKLEPSTDASLSMDADEFPYSVEERLLYRNLQKALAHVRNSVQKESENWILHNLELSNLEGFEDAVLSRLVKDAVYCQSSHLPENSLEKFESAVTQHAEAEWHTHFAGFSKAVSAYRDRIFVELDFNENLQPADFEQSCFQIECDFLVDVGNTLNRIIDWAFFKVREKCQVIHAWILENKLDLEYKMWEIGILYGQKITTLESYSHKNLTELHTQQKQELVEMFKNEFLVTEEARKVALEWYIILLNDQLDSVFDKHVGLDNTASQSNQEDLLVEHGAMENQSGSIKGAEDVMACDEGQSLVSLGVGKIISPKNNKETDVQGSEVNTGPILDDKQDNGNIQQELLLQCGSAKTQSEFEMDSEAIVASDNVQCLIPTDERKMFSRNNKRESEDHDNTGGTDDLDEHVCYATRVGKSDIYYWDGKIMSHGSSAIIYEGQFGSASYTFHNVAVKRFLQTAETEFKNELKIWSEIDEANSRSVYVARLFSNKKWLDNMFLAIELAEMDLGRKVAVLKSTALSNQQHFPKLVGYIQDASKGLYWLHSKNIIHRDIKPAHILIFIYCHNGAKVETAKLTDFGISRIGQDETKPDGTDDWTAPEVLEAKRHERRMINTKSQDIFSLGLTAHFTITLGEHPFACSRKHGKLKILNILDDSVSPSRLPYAQYIANDLIQSMIAKCPVDRPTISNVLKHPVFWDTERALYFFIDFARITDGKKDEAVKTFREIVDTLYGEWYEEIAMSQGSNGDNRTAFNWKEKIVDQKVAYLLKSRRKDYDESSVIKLVELLRDKYMHSGDMVDELKTNEHFGKDGAFSARKYGEFFLKTFPDVLIFLRDVVLSSYGDDYLDLKQIREKYF